MSRVHSASDTCDLYFSYIKVNLLLHTCLLDPFEDGILLDTPLVCMHRYCWSFTDVEEECKRQGTTTPSAREAWKQRWRKKDLPSPERAVLPPKASGTTAQAVLPPMSPALLPCLCAAVGLWPCIPLPLTPSWLRLHILPHLLLVRVSIVIAHVRDRASLIHIGSTP